MGVAIRKLYATNTGDESKKILLSAWIPEKRDGKSGYFFPPNTPLFYDLWVPNVLDLKEEEGPVEVEIVESDKETGLWILCYDDYFGDEQHLTTYKPKFKEGTKKRDAEYANSLLIDEDVDIFDLHVDTNLKLKAGDGPISVTLKRVKNL